MIGIRREDKNRWERRAPLTPDHVAELAAGHGVRFRVQPSPIRIFDAPSYRKAGADIDDDLGGCRVVLGVKEIPIEAIRPRTSYAFFAHVLKGQPAYMPMLRRLMDLGLARRLRASLAASDQAIALNPDQPAAWNNNAYALIHLGRYPEGLRCRWASCSA